MKKRIFIILLFSLFIFVGCEEVKNETLKGSKKISLDEKEEIVYEWDPNNLEVIVRTTRIYTYENGTNTIYNMKAIDCDNYKRQGSLYTCTVDRTDGKVIYKEIESKNYNATKEDMKKSLTSGGYTIEE